MKNTTLLLLSGATLLQAGTPDLATAPLVPAASSWIVPFLDIRVRYEFADVDGYDVSHALTSRERVGLKTTEWNGFSALVEGEFSQAIIDDYNGGAPGADPFDPNNSLIADPETNELNQGYLQYSGHHNLLRVGRQRLIYDSANYIGNVGWRQNEQTFDALTLANKCVDSLTLNYAYVNQVNRIFGSAADGPATNASPNVQDIGSNTHLFNASYTGLEGVTLGGYVYLMDFDRVTGWDNDTYGASAKGDVGGFTLYGEVAYQEKAGPLNNDQAWYAHGTITKAFDQQSLTLGVEFLGSGFQTPLATLHAFNGWADAFVGRRTAGTHGGITDGYLSYMLPVCWDMKWTNVLHAFGDNSLDASLGWEYDTMLLKKFDEHFTGILKVATFDSDDKRYQTTTRASVELNYVF
ncbi:MAG: hypothetical protein K9N23_01655 [Akkermansiaceae bacterium]|nr:hypothetical protein [Akkermansiaceae bacterium]